jgi:hypothetical protein
MNLSRSIGIVTLLTLFLSTAFAARVRTVVTSNDGASLRFKKSYTDRDSGTKTFYLKKKITIPKGSIIEIDSDQTVIAPFVKSGLRVKRSAASYYGGVRIIQLGDQSREGVRSLSNRKREQLARLDLYIYEWSVNKSAIVRALYSEELPAGVERWSDKFMWDEANPSQSWAHHIDQAIDDYGQKLLDNPPRDIQEFCPNYTNLNDRKKKVFWIHLMNSIAKRESRFDPGVGNDESIFNGNDADSTQLNVISRGLMQISYSSARSRHYKKYGCQPTSAASMHTPRTNLQCGIAIFSHLTDGGSNCISCKNFTGKKWIGISRYWSTLREPYEVSCSVCSNGTARVGYKQAIIAETANTSVCRK